MPIPGSLDFEIFHSITEIDPAGWDQLSAGRPFTSHTWYRYGEAVMTDCQPTYLIIYQHNQPIARATFWRTANEPLPVQSAILRRGLQSLLDRWPLLMCYSPFSGTSGLILPDSSLRETAQSIIGARAIELLHQLGCSFLIFSYLPKEQFSGWPENLLPTVVLEPGTCMEIIWPSFEAYLRDGNKKDRQHYKRTLREAQKLEIVVQRHSRVDNVEEALGLIRNVEQRFGSAENPWARRMLEQVDMVGGVFLTATIGDKLVGCGLALQDNGAQVNAMLGLAEGVPYVYFMLVYESLKLAFDHHAQRLRMGSGAYEVKQQLGFVLEDNNSLLFSASNPLLQKTGQWLEKHI
jgi:predicted N-acyltransferase